MTYLEFIQLLRTDAPSGVRSLILDDVWVDPYSANEHGLAYTIQCWVPTDLYPVLRKYSDEYLRATPVPQAGDKTGKRARDAAKFLSLCKKPYDPHCTNSLTL